VLGSVMIDGNFTTNNVTILSFALDATTGNIVWTQPIGSGTIPSGFVSPSPVISDATTYFHNPLDSSVTALNLADGNIRWTTTITQSDPGKRSWGTGVLINSGAKLIQPVGANLITLDTATGKELNSYNVGGSFTYNFPTVSGKTLYIGNAWGWTFAFPLSTITSDSADG
jgi:outer membrane protein assembly factor BamB